MNEFDQQFKEKYPLCYAAGVDGNDFNETELHEKISLLCNKHVSKSVEYRQIEILNKLQKNEELTVDDINDCQLVQDLPDEHWRLIEGWNQYNVSSAGRVKNVIKNKLVKPATSDSGYNIVSLCNCGKIKSESVHRLVALAFIPKTEEDIRLGRDCVNHIDGNKMNNRVTNLEWCTTLENQKHAKRTGLWNCIGENSTLSKLTTAQVVEIRQRVKAGEYMVDLCKEYGVAESTIQAAVSRGHYPEADAIAAPFAVGIKQGISSRISKFHDPKIIIDIRVRHRCGESLRKIGKIYGVDSSVIYEICAGISYKDVKDSDYTDLIDELEKKYT